MPPLSVIARRLLLAGLLATLVAPLALGQAPVRRQPRASQPSAPAAPTTRHHPPGGPAGTLLVAAGDLRGEIKPCGCSPEGQMGGLPRRLTYLQQLEKDAGEPVVKVDLGNNFPEPSPQGRLKVDFIQTALRQARLDAILPGPNELALGVATLDRTLPYVVSNSPNPAPLSPRRIINLAGRRRIIILGYLSPTEVYQGAQSEFHLDAVAPALLERWKVLLRSEGATTAVLLFRGTDGELSTLVRSGMFGAVISGNPSGDELKQVTERIAADVLVPQVPTKGQGVLRMRVGASPKPPEAEVDWLKDTYADHPQAVQAMAAYDEKVKSLFFEQAAAAEAHRSSSPYAGAEACKTCHAPAYDIWQGARHANALASLRGVNKQYDPECLACHTVGLGRGGYISQDATPHLANVQCENCHGPAKAHVAAPRLKPVPLVGAGPRGLPSEATCRTCHRGSHSPSFDFSIYWPKIAHSGPGMTVTPAKP